MKACILLLTILGMFAIDVVKGSPTAVLTPEDPVASAVSDINILSRRKRANYCCWKLHVDYRREHSGDTQHKNKAKDAIPFAYQHYQQEPGLVNGRPHWTSLDKKRAIWWSSSKGVWIIGNASGRGQNPAFAYASVPWWQSDSCPMVGYRWKYLDSGKWKDADDSLSIWCNDSTIDP